MIDILLTEGSIEYPDDLKSVILHINFVHSNGNPKLKLCGVFV